MNSKFLRSGLFWLLIIVIGIAVFMNFGTARSTQSPDSIQQLALEIKAGRIRDITVRGDTITAERYDGTRLITRKGSNVTAVEALKNLGVTEEELQSLEAFIVQDDSQLRGLGFLLSSALPLLLFGGLLIFMLRQAQGSNNQAMSFGKSRARMFTGDKPTVTFNDVAGADEAKEELKEVVEFLREPSKFAALGARIPKGVLMVGPPGTGKTLMARAVAGEAGVPFFSISGSEFVEMFVGVGASRVRDLFEQAKRNSPCIIFIDEIDAVGRQRGAGLGGSHDEREQTLNQILVEMDGFDTDTNVIVIAATNRPDILDPALLRPGRFDRRVVLDRPDVRGRRAILGVHVRGKPLASDVDLDAIARGTPGFTGADLENLVNEAAILAARRKKRVIGMAEFNEAIERVVMGPERRSRLLSEEERRLTAYHEAGHAVVMYHMPHADQVHKITIIPRGRAGGYTWYMPEEERTLYSYSQFLDRMASMLGGRAAEEIVFGDVSTGASNDLKQVTELARAMVTRYGMSERLGPLQYGEREEMVFLGREITEHRNYSEKVAREIDAEVKRLVTEAYERALQVLREHRDQLEAVAQRLLEVETLEREEFEELMVRTSMTDLALDEEEAPQGSDEEAQEDAEA
ncbi:cell division protease FtsH [Ardenticatena maritima]|uniref:ATP-dependent zinc metalloprotease FtsH n=1 Tax=Ardenticatena maritima TaxID=872965 RepID=A0A0M8K844_9CHLR|nr:ATP-dependent zinc metalloprotease FtsH [Ardenticatena maritima]KPL86463.1 cell division protein FtsH [Ardenticatena maritima]GAP62246.1 cell division protease FtsH [Ardenticatena maritima]